MNATAAQHRERPTDPDEIAAALQAPFHPKTIGWRAGKTLADRKVALAMAYIDARDVIKRLEAVLGINNWQSHYHEVGKYLITCELSLRINGEWITKSDGAWIGNVASDGKVDPKREQEIDMEGKGAYSSALKRAAVQFGIGRYLYDLEAPWAECEVRQEKWNKWTPAGLEKLNAVASKPYDDWKAAMKKRRAERAQAEATASQAALPAAPAPTTAPAASASEPASGPMAPTDAPQPAPAAPVSATTTVQSPQAAPAAPTPTTAPTTNEFPQPTGTVQDRMTAYTDALKAATDVERVKAIAGTAKNDPDFGNGTTWRKILKTAIEEAMKRIDPTWKPEPRQAAGTSPKVAA